MHVDTALVVGRCVLEIVGEAQRGGKFLASFGIEIGLAATAVDRAVTDADVG